MRVAGRMVDTTSVVEGAGTWTAEENAHARKAMGFVVRVLGGFRVSVNL